MKAILMTTLAVAAAMTAAAQPAELVVQANKIGAEIQPTMYGMFFEDINFGADGGLYGELVKNRSFEYPQALMGWQAFGNWNVKDDGPFDRCPHYVVLAPASHHDRRTGLVNEGYFGIGVKEGENYDFSVWAKAPDGASEIKVQLIDPSSADERQEFAEAVIPITIADWQKYTAKINSPLTHDKASLRIYLNGNSEVALEHISLFPEKTFKGRANGCREDIAQALADGHPGVFRFPGGCIVEGVDLATRYQWKNTVGPVENRPINENRWEYTFPHRYFADYYQSGGLGFFEFFQLAEDIGAEPLPVLNVGMACQFQNWDDESAHVPLDQLQPYIDDCLDLIEFANGPADSPWGKVRAEMGHPEPFNMKIIAVGNEQWGDMYYKRLKPFVAAIRARYPDIKIVGTSGPDSEGSMFEKGWQAMREQKADLVDEHFYRGEDWFLDNKNTLRYEKYDRKGPKVFAGEYACHGKGKKWNHYEASILEAGFMTDFERNADVVHMTAYAPLLAHVDGWQWRPDLIWYDNNNIAKTTSYYVQQMYATNKGTNMVPLTWDGRPVAALPGQNGLEASAVYDRDADCYIVKVINTSMEPQPVAITLKGLKNPCAVAVTTTLYHTVMDDENTVSDPDRIRPAAGTVAVTARGKDTLVSDTLTPMTFKVYRIGRAGAAR